MGIVISFNDSQSSNALLPMFITLLEIVISFNDLQNANALLPIVVTLSGIIHLVKFFGIYFSLIYFKTPGYST